jgi:diadenylate cyclase
VQAPPVEFMESALAMVAPGTALREGLDSVLAARTGALIVIGDSENVESICNGGLLVDVPFEAERLFELCKMDGAIILDQDAERILRANVHLVPDPHLETSETGIRHRTAERVSLQTDALVIAISQRRGIISLYRAGEKLILEDIDVVLAKANQALQTLQRYRVRLNEVSSRLTSLEFEDMVTLDNVVTVIQRSESMQRVSRELARYISQLGVEGRLVRMQSDELMLNVEEDYQMLLRDYTVDSRPRKITAVKTQIAELEQDQLLDGTVIAHLLGYPASADVLEQRVESRGYRMLNRIPLLPGPVVHRLIERFGDLSSVLKADEDELNDVDGVGDRRASAIREGLRRMAEQGTV